MTDFDRSLDALNRDMVVAIGVPFDDHSSFLRGPAEAPARIRALLHAGSSNFCAENGVDLETVTSWQDIGDLTFSSDLDPFVQIEQTLDRLLERDARVLSLGGDHSITYPFVRAYAKKYPQLSILHIDAHPDLYDEFEGNRYSHACPFARIMEAKLANRLVQVGIRTINPHQRQQADRFGVEVIEMRNWNHDTMFEFTDPVYLSLDIDALDPAFAPGVSHHEPGGFATRDVLHIIQNLKGTIVGADIVEFNPTRDPSGITGMAAAKFYKEIVARMIT